MHITTIIFKLFKFQNKIQLCPDFFFSRFGLWSFVVTFGYFLDIFFLNYWKTPNMSLIKKEYVKSTFYLLDE